MEDVQADVLSLRGAAAMEFHGGLSIAAAP